MALITREFLEQALLAVDPTIDVSSGSPADMYLITPLLERLGDDPIWTEFDKLARDLLRSRFPDLLVDEGSAIGDALIKPMKVLLEPLYAQLKVISQNQSLINWRQMDDREVDALLANFFYTRPSQTFASGTVRIYFTSPRDVEVGDGDIFYSRGGLRFVPAWPDSFTAEQMSLNVEGGLYYVDVTVVAEQVGSEYNISAGEIVRVDGIPQAVKVTNPTAFSGGSDLVDNEMAISNARSLLSSRTLVTANGIISTLLTEFPSLRGIQVVGAGDDEMMRDLLSGGLPSEPIAWGSDALPYGTNPDDTTTGTIAFQFGVPAVLQLATQDQLSRYRLVIADQIMTPVKVINSTTLQVDRRAFTPRANFGPAILSGTCTYSAGSDAIIDTSTDFLGQPVHPGDMVKIGGNYYKILQVGYIEDANFEHRLKLDTVFTTSVISASYEVYRGYHWQLLDTELELNETPDLLTDTAVTPGCHVGGKVDIYVAGDLQDQQVHLEGIADQQAPMGFNLRRHPTYDYIVIAPGQDFSDTPMGSTLHIYDGPAVGVYQIKRVDPLNSSQLHVSPSISTVFTGASYRVSDTIDVEFTNPANVKLTGNDLRLSAGSAAVTTTSLVDFSSFGVQAGDYCKVKTGSCAGDYLITAVTGTGNTTIVFENPPPFSDVAEYEIYSKIGDVVTPVIEISQVELANSDGTSQGTVVPYGAPLGGVGTSTVNAGDGGIDENPLVVIVGIVSDFEDEFGSPATIPLSGKQLTITIDGSTLGTVSFSTDYSSLISVADKITSDLGAMVDKVRVAEWRGRTYLAISSPDHKIEVSGSAIAVLGIAATDSTKLRAYRLEKWDDWDVSDYVDWSQYDEKRLRIEVDLSLGVDRLFVEPFSTGSTWIYGHKPDGTFPTAGVFTGRAGQASVGKVRVWFRDPTVTRLTGPKYRKVLFDGSSYSLEPKRTATSFTYGGKTFYPDTAQTCDIYPADDGSLPNNGKVAASGRQLIQDNTTLDNRSDLVDTWLTLAQVGDVVEIVSKPLIGTEDVAALTLPTDITGGYMTLVLDQKEIVVNFTDNDTTLDAVVDKINLLCGQDLAWLRTSGSSKYLVLETDSRLSVVVTTDFDDVGQKLMYSTAGEYSNKPDAAGTYTIVNISTDGYTLTLDMITPFSSAEENLHWKIYREGCAGATVSTMTQDEDTGLYYVDIDVASEGFGNSYNIDAGQIFDISDDDTLGWTTYSDVDSVSYSEREKLWLRFTPILPSQGDFTPANYIYAEGQHMLVSYRSSNLVSEIQGWVEASSERVLSADLLVKHLLPARLYLGLDYQGGPDADSVRSYLEDLISQLVPEEGLSVQDIVEMLLKRGAEDVTHPIQLLAVSWTHDRKLTLDYSEDRIIPTRQSILYLERLVVRRR